MVRRQPLSFEGLRILEEQVKKAKYGIINMRAIEVSNTNIIAPAIETLEL